MARFASLIPLAAVLVLTGCNMKQALAPDPEAQKAAEAAYAELVKGDLDTLFTSMPKEADTPQQRRLAEALRVLIPDGQAGPGKIVTISKQSGTAGQIQQLAYVYDYGAEKVRFNVVLHRKDKNQPWAPESFNLAPAQDGEAGFNFGTSQPPPVKPPVPSKAPAGSKSASDPA